MEKWFDEVRLSSRPIEEIGIAFYIRDILNNDCTINRWDLRDTFGEKNLEHIENLKRAGILKVETTATHFTFKVVAPGDKHRLHSKMRATMKRKEMTRNDQEDR